MAEELRKWYDCKNDGRAFRFYPMCVYEAGPVGNIFSRDYAEFFRDLCETRGEYKIWDMPYNYACFKIFPRDEFWCYHGRLNDAISQLPQSLREIVERPDEMRHKTAKKILQEAKSRQEARREISSLGKGFGHEVCLKLATYYKFNVLPETNPYVDRHCEYAAVHFFERMGFLEIEHVPVSCENTVTYYTLLDVNQKLLESFVNGYEERQGIVSTALEVDEDKEADRKKCRMLKVNLLVEEGNGIDCASLYFVCNGKKELLKKFNGDSASKAVTLHAIKNPGKDISIDELWDEYIAPTGAKSRRANDYLRAWPEAKKATEELIKQIFFKYISGKHIYFLGEQKILLP